MKLRIKMIFLLTKARLIFGMLSFMAMVSKGANFWLKLLKKILKFDI